ncbi:MAG TPA: TonB family protein [Gemmatimonadales bacterium]
MFENLIESGRPMNAKSFMANSTISIIVHAVLITAAVYATLHAGEAVHERVHAVAIAVAKQEEKKEEPPPEQKIAQVNPPPKGFQTLSIPTNIPVDIPPPQTNQHFDAADFSGVGVEGGVAKGVEGGTGPVVTDQPYMEAVVEERPELIPGTCISPSYPPVLQQAGIEGRVLVEFVIDTTGRAERASLRTVSTSHPLFEAPARTAVMSCRFKPGRIQGRAVRVRVQQPINFNMAGR